MGSSNGSKNPPGHKTAKFGRLPSVHGVNSVIWQSWARYQLNILQEVTGIAFDSLISITLNDCISRSEIR